MSKLQLYITKSGNTYKSLFNLNPSGDVQRHVYDVAAAVGKVEYDPAEKTIFYLLTTVEEGFFITVLRTIPPRRNDHLAAWIFVPKGTDITAEELEGVVRLTTRKVSGAEVTNDDVVALREAFGVEYSAIADAPYILPNDADSAEYAWRNYGGNSGLTLQNFCGNGLWQLAYVPYAGVLLADAELGFRIEGKSLNGRPIAAPAVILPAPETEAGFTAHVFGRVLDCPMAANLDAVVPVIWSRPGFEDVVVNCRIDSVDYTPQPPETATSQKTIATDAFLITSQSTREPLKDCQIRVNGLEITEEGHAFTVDELRKAAVVITSDGYFPFSGEIDLAAKTRAMIHMTERRRIYRFEMPVVSSELGAPVKFEIRSKKAITESPIEGYEVMGEIQEGATRANHLGYVGPGRNLTGRAIYAAAGLGLGMIIMYLCMAFVGGGSKETTLAPAANPDSIVSVPIPQAVVPNTPAAPEPKKEEPAQKEEQKPEQVPEAHADMASAVKYLDDNTVWTKEDLEKHPELRGLYDDINNYRIDRLINHWGPKLKASERMQKIVHHATLGKNKKKPEGTYNKPNDTKIAVQGFLNRIDP